MSSIISIQGDDEMNIAGIGYDSIADGEGVRAAIFISGCKHHCPECHNPQTWDFNFGKKFDVEEQNNVIEYVKRCDGYVDGITLTGGDPMYSAKELIFFVKRFKEECPDKTIWIYSGFTYEEIMKDKDIKRLVKLRDVS